MDPVPILILLGHPDPRGDRYLRALAGAYAEGARAAGHPVELIDIAALDFPMLRSADDWQHGEMPAALGPAREALAHARHVVLFFPLWMGGMPALAKGFLEQLLRPGFAVARQTQAGGALPGAKLLSGRSARIVVTMGMPALVYRWWFRAHDVKALERNILGMVGITPVRESIVGSVEGSAEARATWLARMRALGRRAE